MSKNKVLRIDIKKDDVVVWRGINESTSTGGAGPYKVPISPGLKSWEKSSLEPFVEPVSKYISAELQYDSYDGIMDSKNIKTKEHIAQKISRELKKHVTNQDDDGLGAGMPSTSSSESGGEPISEDIRIIKELLSEDLAVWFGKKKKPKGSKQPKGPWVNICRKVDGKHPPCGRPEAGKGAYPKCRAAGVAGKMSDSQKKSACAQKRRAEKKDPQRGKGQKPVYTSYKTRKESIDDRIPLREKFKVNEGEFKKLYDTEDFLLIIPLTHNASCKYGANTKWCTSSKNPKDFERHIGMGSLAYLIIKNKEIQNKLKNEKFAFYMNIDEKQNINRAPSLFDIIIYDEKNINVNRQKFINMFDSINRYSEMWNILKKYLDYSQNNFIQTII